MADQSDMKEAQANATKAERGAKAPERNFETLEEEIPQRWNPRTQAPYEPPEQEDE